MSLIDITGERYGRLTVLGRAPSKKGHTMWKCLCDCGNVTSVYGCHLKSGKTKSCGCYNSELIRERSVTHGETGQRLYSIWQNMKNRCRNPNTDRYYRYGARGIKVCDEWYNSYESFRDWAISSGYSDNLTIDRIDVDGDYSPENCRWSTAQEQMNNTSTNRYIEYNGEVHTMADWSRKLGISYSSLLYRFNVAKMSVEEALDTKGESVVFNEH